MSSFPRTSGLTVVLVLVLGLTACGGRHPAAPSTPPSASAAPVSSSAVAAPVNPLTGLAPPATGPVIAVKVDDTAAGRPQHGIDQADVVYIEQAEGGLSRLVAVFATNKPAVEPVRSVRASDPELLTQYGRITPRLRRWRRRAADAVRIDAQSSHPRSWRCRLLLGQQQRPALQHGGGPDQDQQQRAQRRCAEHRVAVPGRLHRRRGRSGPRRPSARRSAEHRCASTGTRHSAVTCVSSTGSGRTPRTATRTPPRTSSSSSAGSPRIRTTWTSTAASRSTPTRPAPGSSRCSATGNETTGPREPKTKGTSPTVTENPGKKARRRRGGGGCCSGRDRTFPPPGAGGGGGGGGGRPGGGRSSRLAKRPANGCLLMSTATVG